MQYKLFTKLLLLSCVGAIVTACSTTQGPVTTGVSVNNNIGTSPQIGPATETLTINGTQVPQYSTVMVKAPITANSPVTIYYNGSYPCQPGGCTVALQLPSSCYANGGAVTVNGMLTYNVVQGYFVRGLNCGMAKKVKKKRMHH